MKKIIPIFLLLSFFLYLHSNLFAGGSTSSIGGMPSDVSVKNYKSNWDECYVTESQAFTPGKQSDENSKPFFSETLWFSALTGLASIISLLLAIYPVQIKNLPPSVFRSIIWKKSLLISFGVGISITACTQFYIQSPPQISFLYKLHVLMHGHQTGYAHGPSIWGFLILIGVILLIFGYFQDPAKIIRKKIMEHIKTIQNDQKIALKKILNGKSYSELSEVEKDEYNQAYVNFVITQHQIIELLSGISINYNRYANFDAKRQIQHLFSTVKEKFSDNPN